MNNSNELKGYYGDANIMNKREAFEQLYDKFRMQWIAEHVSIYQLFNHIESYKKDDEGCSSFEEYLNEYGFDGSLYPCFNEWFNNEVLEQCKSSYVLEKEFEYNGYKCMILFMNGGYRTGYVAIPEGHPLYNKTYHEMDELDGFGLSFSGMYNPYTLDKSEFNWIGIDFNGCYHLRDIEFQKKYFPSDTLDLSFMAYKNSHLKNLPWYIDNITLSDMQKCLKDLVDKVIELNK